MTPIPARNEHDDWWFNVDDVRPNLAAILSSPSANARLVELSKRSTE